MTASSTSSTPTPCRMTGSAHPDYQRLLDVVLDRAQACVKPLEEDLLGVDSEVEVIADRPAHAIAGVAATREADEIIVGTRGFGRARALLGSVAARADPSRRVPRHRHPRARDRARRGAGQRPWWPHDRNPPPPAS